MRPLRLAKKIGLASLTVFAFNLGSTTAFARAPTKLFESGDEPSEVILNDGTKIKVRLAQELGAGWVTRVFAVENNKHFAFRAKNFSNDSERSIEKAEQMMDEFYQGNDELEKQGVPKVKILGLSKDGILVERLPPGSINLKTYLEARTSFSRADRKRYDDALITFAKSCAAFQHIGDFKPSQIHYVEGRGWVLADWSANHVLASREHKDFLTPFNWWKELIDYHYESSLKNFRFRAETKNLIDQLVQATLEERIRRHSSLYENVKLDSEANGSCNSRLGSVVLRFIAP